MDLTPEKLPGLGEVVKDLEHVTYRLRRLGFLVLLVTALNVAVGALVAGPNDFHSQAATTALAVGNASLAAVALLLLGMHDTLRRRGDALFQELSDELQWYVGRRGDAPPRTNPEPTDRPSIEVRVAMRSFAAAAELPLGPSVTVRAYAVVNLLALVLPALISYTSL